MPLEKLGPYRITHLLGRGGMGAVYEGIHTDTGEHAAVKILSAAFADDSAFRARFAAEIETLKTLRHPNIVRLIGFGEQDGILFYSMELVTGRNLHDEMRAGRQFTWQEVAELGIQVCAALKHAHDHGVIHRDLKPANLLLAPDGTFKLTDFGIAKLFGATNLTSVGGVIGTVDFMSPEQAEGNSVTIRSDLYSLGGVMYTLLAGHPPYAGRNATEVLQRMRNFAPPSIRGVNPGVPQELEDIILQLLERDPQKRIPTALVLAKRLRAMLHGLASMAQARADEDAEASDNQASDNEATDNEASDSQAAEREVTESGDSKTREVENGAIENPGSGASSGEGDRTRHAAVTGITREVTPSQLHEIPWEDETIETGAGKRKAANLPARETPNSFEGSTLAPSKFTTIDDERAVRSQGGVSHESTGGEHPWVRTASLAGLVVALLILVAAASYFLRPTSADVLYERIQTVAADVDGGDLVQARRDIDEFLRHYGDDPRSTEVHNLQLDHDAHRLWRRLERTARKAGGAEYLPEVEKAFVFAMREESVDPGSAFEQYQSLLATYRDETALSDEARECLAASRHRAERLTPRISVPQKDATG